MLKRNIFYKGQSLQMSLTLFLLLCSFDASSWPRFHEPGVRESISCGICVMGLSLPSYSHFHISQSPVEFWRSWGKNFWGLPRKNGLEQISLPANCDTATSRRAPRARKESGKEDDGRVFVPLPLCLQKQITVGEAHEELRTPRGSFSCPLPPLQPSPSLCVRSSKRLL